MIVGLDRQVARVQALRSSDVMDLTTVAIETGGCGTSTFVDVWTSSDKTETSFKRIIA